MQVPRRWKLKLLRHASRLPFFFVAAWVAAIGLALVTGTRPRGWWFGSLLLLVLLAALLATWARWQREVAIRESALPQYLKRKLREAYPHLDGRDCDLVERGFRQFFIACLRSNTRFVSMPSKAVDAFWHEFILHTRAYAQWCELTLGRFLHHTPAEVLGAKASDNDGLRRAWFWSCKEESINARKPSRLPLLFALDAKLGVADGFRYVTDCSGVRKRGEAVATAGAGAVHCATDFSDGSYAGDADGMGGVDSSEGGGSDGGDGGSSCGGSCGSD
jgi:hypothetical protein